MKRYRQWRWKRKHRCEIDYPKKPLLCTIVTCPEDRCGARYIYEEFTWSEWGPTHDMSYNDVGWVKL